MITDEEKLVAPPSMNIPISLKSCIVVPLSSCVPCITQSTDLPESTTQAYVTLASELIVSGISLAGVMEMLKEAEMKDICINSCVKSIHTHTNSKVYKTLCYWTHFSVEFDCY